MADFTRATKAKALLTSTIGDLQAMELELRRHLDQEIALKEEIPELKKEVRMALRMAIFCGGWGLMNDEN